MKVEKTGCSNGLGVGWREEKTPLTKWSVLPYKLSGFLVDRPFSTVIPADHSVYSPVVPAGPVRYTIPPDHQSSVLMVTVACEI